MRSTPWIRDMRIDGTRIGDLVDAVPRFTVSGSGDGTRLTPASPAATWLLTSQYGGVRERIEAGIASLDTGAARTSLTGISLPNTHAGSVFDGVVSSLAE